MLRIFEFIRSAAATHKNTDTSLQFEVSVGVTLLNPQCADGGAVRSGEGGASVFTKKEPLITRERARGKSSGPSMHGGRRASLSPLCRSCRYQRVIAGKKGRGTAAQSQVVGGNGQKIASLPACSFLPSFLPSTNGLSLTRRQFLFLLVAKL